MKIHCFLYFLLIAPVFAEKITPEQIKSGIIFKFAENIIWPEEARGLYFSIGFFGKDKGTYAALVSDALDLTINDQKVTVSQVKKLKNLSGLKLLYVDSVMAVQRQKLLRAAKNAGILLITESSKDERYIMLDIFYNPKTKRYTYRFNRNNILSAGLEMKMDLLLHGGTKDDLKAKLQSVHDSLEAQRKQVLNRSALPKKLRSKADSLKRQLKKNETQIKAQNQQLAKQAEELKAQKQQLESRAKQLKAQKWELKQLMLSMQEKQHQMDLKTKALSTLAAKVESSKHEVQIEHEMANRPADSLIPLKQEVEQSQEPLKAEKSKLAKESIQSILQPSQIEMKPIILALAVGFSALSIGLLVVVFLLVKATYRSSKARKGIDEKLEQMVQERLQELIESTETANKGILEHIQSQTDKAKWKSFLK